MFQGKLWTRLIVNIDRYIGRKTVYITLPIVSCLYVFTGIGQTPQSKEWSFHIGTYANNGIRPGAIIGLEYGIKDKLGLYTKVKPGKGAHPHTRVHQAVAGVNLNCSWIPRTSLTVLANFTWEYRRTTKRRIQYQIGLGPGWARSILPNVYAVTASGEVQKKTLAGRTYFAPVSFVGIGYYRKGSRSLQWWHFRITNALFYNYNAFLLPFIATELRLGFHKKPSER